MDRAVMSKKDLLLIGGILIIALLLGGFFLLQQGENSGVAALSVDGSVVALYDLEKESDRFIDLQEFCGVPVTLEIQDGAIRFYESLCPDHICENYGFISREGETAVCMPNRTVLTIHSHSDRLSLGE